MITLLASATALLGCGRRAEDLLPKGAPVPERVLSPIPKFSGRLLNFLADSFEAYTGGVITDTTRYEGTRTS